MHNILIHDDTTATAPYNFVQLPQSILPSPLNDFIDVSGIPCTDDIVEGYQLYIEEQGNNSGVIDLEIKTLSPCFIGGNGEEFFAPTGEPLIPGSSLRGMIKNIFKVITCGAMRRDEDFNDCHLYFRCIMAPKKMPQIKKLNEYYMSRMKAYDKNGKEVLDDDGLPRKSTHAGFLIREHGQYYICPSLKTRIPSDQDGTASASCIDWKEGKAYCLNNQRRNSYVWCLSGAAWDYKYEISKKVFQEYIDDKNRKGVDVVNGKFVLHDKDAQKFTGCDDIDRVAPCFYILKDGQVQTFGHRRTFRIPYEKTVGEHVPASLQEDTIDFSDAVFGKKEFWGSRVFFEDAHIQGEPSKMDRKSITLMKPNPTSYQLYLEQDGKRKYPDYWDDAKNIRGYKMYWHQPVSADAWKDPVSEDDEHSHNIIPLNRGTTFHGTIRFENLSNQELGALMNVFIMGDKPKSIGFKLGQGKGLGMGSIQIKPTLKIIDKAKYLNLFNAAGWEDSLVPVDPQQYIQAYQDSLENHRADYDHIISELTHILNRAYMTTPSWPKNVASMNGDVQSGTVDPRYVERAVLPTIAEVVAKKK
jgi:hypothetical protein